MTAATPEPCVFPRCIEGEKPDYCGRCSGRPAPYEDEWAKRDEPPAATLHPCALPKCKREATVAHDVRSSFARLDAFVNHDGDQAKIAVTHYEVCDKHDREFFGRGGFLSVEQSDRIKKKLVAS